ncbi:hypothetical protein LCL89_06800 [Halobacillus yeomjeoni]|uniref:hypothetical protein n=1 Tax=Halobacillus yeomjeoni TaxID=311194 RepID=UPI001CD23DB9|nr:hypothetical protein [Halobacillus yeomjeoni]MCA0983765.1 hypothetical protein [Halobacillus yeomjeoni]
MSCNGCGCCGFCCPDEEPQQQGFCPCCTRTLVDILQAIIDQSPGEAIRIDLPGPANFIGDAVPIQIRSGFTLQIAVGQNENQSIVNICDIVALTGDPVDDVDLSSIPGQENCECCEEALTEVMEEIASDPTRSFNMNTQGQNAMMFSSGKNPTEVFDGVVRYTSGNMGQKAIVSLCQVSSIDLIKPQL